jgi:hypothetical protein
MTTRIESDSPPVETTVRAITAAEIDTLWEKGWATIPGLISPETAAELLAAAKGWMGEDGNSHQKRPGIDKIPVFFEVFNHPSHQNEAYHRVLHSGFGANVCRVLGRETPVRILDENVAVKLPQGAGGQPTGFHQDFCFLPFDRLTMMWWIALDDVTPDMGMMRFRTGSHRYGPLGRTQFETEEELLAAWPRLADLPLEHPEHLAPGDATVHLGLTVHGAPSNATDRPRWSYIAVGFPGDALRTIRHRTTDELDLPPLAPIDHPDFPVVYTPARA